MRPIRTHEITVEYYQIHEEDNPFGDTSALDAADIDHTDDIKQGIGNMMEAAKQNELPTDKCEEFQTSVKSHVYIFRASFSARPYAEVKPLHIELFADAKAVRVRLQNYSQEQR